jgi:2-polyprenyl-6-methoxyphenol hydroxylase-like FAD-dependent oxidoreductase
MRVLISGAGIAGPTLAWFLAKPLARITVLEKSSGLRSEGHNIDIDGSAIAIINKMGILDEIKRLNTTEIGTRILASDGKPIATFPFNKGSSIDPTSEYEILRGDLANILYEASKSRPNVDYMFGTTVEEVLQNDQELVKVRLSNGEEREFDLLVVADGQWSKLRKWCFPPETVQVVDKDMYVVYCTIPRRPEDTNYWNCYIGLKSRNITLRPDPHGTIRAMLTKMPCDEAERTAWQEAVRGDREMQRELLRKTYADAGWEAERILAAMDKSPDFYFQAVQQIKMSKWSSGRVVCIGDAAFAPTPISGMGTTSAIHAAYMLAGEISKLGNGEHPARALEAFEAALRPAIERVQSEPDYPWVVHPTSAWHRWMLQNTMWAVTKIVQIPFVATRMLKSRQDHFTVPEYPNLDRRERDE